MLPVAKALVITVLLGGGAVGTCALAGGFGPGGSGSGNGETTTQVAATETTNPVAPVQGVVPAAPTPEATTLPEVGVTRDGSSDLEGNVQQKADASDGQSLQSVPQVNSQSQEAGSGRPEDQRDVEARGSDQEQRIDTQTNDRARSEPSSSDTPEGEKGVKDEEKTNLKAGDTTRDVNPSDSQTGLQGAKVVGSEESQDDASGNQRANTGGETGATSVGGAVGSSSTLVTPDGTQTSNGPVSGESGVSGASSSARTSEGETITVSGGEDTRST